MANFFRYRPVLSGFIGAPGINTWHGQGGLQGGGINESDAENFQLAIRAVYNAMLLYIAPGVTISFPGEMTLHDVETGQLVNVIPLDPLPDLVASDVVASAQESRATQLVVHHATDDVRRGRRLAGRHFIGPASGYALDGAGQVKADARNAIQAAYGGIVDVEGSNLCVYGAPITNEFGTVVAAGQLAVVKAVTVRSKPGVLRSRRD